MWHLTPLGGQIWPSAISLDAPLSPLPFKGGCIVAYNHFSFLFFSFLCFLLAAKEHHCPL